MPREETPPKGAPEWMVTYSDVISLLVTFFVMLLTFSTSDRDKFDKAAGSLKGALGVSQPDTSRLPQTGMITDRYLTAGRTTAVGMDFPPEYEPLLGEVFDLNGRLKQNNYGTTIQIENLRQGLMLRMSTTLLFIPGTARLAPGAEEHLRRIGRAVMHLHNPIEVVAHVGSDFAGNPLGMESWNLSQERASVVTEYFRLQTGIASSRLSAGGMGGTSPRGTRLSALDNRVEITLLHRQE